MALEPLPQLLPRHHAPEVANVCLPGVGARKVLGKLVAQSCLYFWIFLPPSSCLAQSVVVELLIVIHPHLQVKVQLCICALLHLCICEVVQVHLCDPLVVVLG